MAPSTRLSVRPELRVDYRRFMPTGQAVTARNSVILEDTSPPQEPVTRPTKTKEKAATNPTRDSQGRFIKSGIPEKPESDRKKVVKATAPPKMGKKVRPEKTECVICATTKNTKHSFKATDVENACEHYQNICDVCIQKQIKTKIATRQLTDAHLPCMFPSCEAVLDHTTLKKVMSKALFEAWDTAVTKHLLAADPSYIAYLNPDCGIYFSAEDCGSKQKNYSSKSKPKTKKQNVDKATCPYCDHELCLSCNRLWHSGSCNSAKRRENKQSENTIKKMGAKPCPKCGVNIEKQGGCDHMTCRRCHQNFCWECLGDFGGGNEGHAETCSHHRPMIAQDIGNFADPNLTVAQVNALIDQARREREAGRVPRPNLQLAPGVRLVNGAAVHPPLLPPPTLLQR